jgi:hypothetical protein
MARAKVVIIDLVKQLLKTREELMAARYSIFGMRCEIKRRESELHREQQINGLAIQHIPEDKQLNFRMSLPPEPTWTPGMVCCASLTSAYIILNLPACSPPYTCRHNSRKWGGLEQMITKMYYALMAKPLV